MCEDEASRGELSRKICESRRLGDLEVGLGPEEVILFKENLEMLDR